MPLKSRKPTAKEKSMQDTFYSPIIALGGHLTSMHRERPKGIFKFNVGFQSAIPKELLAGCGQRNGRVQIEGSGGPVFHPNGEITYRVRQPLKIRFNPSEGPLA
jgi:hypothetical protein